MIKSYRLQTCNKHFQRRPRPDGSTTIIDRPLQLPVLVILSQGDPLTHLVSAVNLEADRLASSIFQMPHFLRSFPQNKPITNQWIKIQTMFACNMAVPWSQRIKGSQTGWFSMVSHVVLLRSPWASNLILEYATKSFPISNFRFQQWCTCRPCGSTLQPWHLERWGLLTSFPAAHPTSPKLRESSKTMKSIVSISNNNLTICVVNYNLIQKIVTLAYISKKISNSKPFFLPVPKHPGGSAAFRSGVTSSAVRSRRWCRWTRAASHLPAHKDQQQHQDCWMQERYVMVFYVRCDLLTSKPFEIKRSTALNLCLDINRTI